MRPEHSALFPDEPVPRCISHKTHSMSHRPWLWNWSSMSCREQNHPAPWKGRKADNTGVLPPPRLHLGSAQGFEHLHVSLRLVSPHLFFTWVRHPLSSLYHFSRSDVGFFSVHFSVTQEVCGLQDLSIYFLELFPITKTRLFAVSSPVCAKPTCHHTCFLTPLLHCF